ncbi:malonate decarboxylase subunit epsilon [Martelella alba]|uniref:[acyl-carrier-protein] S-malonyltransferase n=1 Tax=Martelella alba TaxID=2590451 RepID=A0ABY2SI39_9HYPH|nr:malonate decarboxylase subunit epsilon [Martelella alba]TKI05026.1 malonate decarboxylase subunit epsilon [Martelella alba]
MKILLTFPGQGAQTPGMLHRLPEDEESLRLLECASDVLGKPALDLDDAQALRSTRAVQLCLYIAGVIHARRLLRAGVVADYTSGLSIGAFPAAVVAGALDYEAGLRLVALRGELMERAYPAGYGLSAITGLSRVMLEGMISRVHGPDRPVYLANLNADDQFVIAGSEPAMAEVCEQAMAQGAARAQRLAVAVPSHCALLDKPAEALAEAFASVELRRPTLNYLSGSTGRVLVQPKRIAEDLAMNMARPVHWQDAMLSAYQRDVRLAIEMPPGAVLTGLTKRVMEQGEAVAFSQNSLSLILGLARRLKSEDR